MVEKPPPLPRGEPLAWSDAALDRLSELTDADIEQAAQTWRDHAPPSLRTLLDATEEDPLNG